MCGIAGYYNASITKDQIDSAVKNLTRRGPDDCGSYTLDDVGLIHTRLSILELSSLGSQPYQYKDLTVVYNGEIYNYKEVRSQLVNLGYEFKSNSDVEVLVKAFHCWKELCVHRFIGMFAFAIYDKGLDSLWLFRDRLGVKPIYYELKNNSILFASETSTLAILGAENELDERAIHSFFRYGFVKGRRSIYRSVTKLEPGHFLKVTRKGSKVEKYWELSIQTNYAWSEKQWIDRIEEMMISSFSYRMIADVPVGVFLSGGIDSSLLCAILNRHYGPIQSFTIGFSDVKYDESLYAKKVASHIGIGHTQKLLELREAKETLDNFYSIYDEPFADTSGIPTHCVTQLAKANGAKVVLSADGGDELFAGYTHYRRANRLNNFLKRFPAFTKKVINFLSKGILSPQLRSRIYSFNLEHKLYSAEELLIITKATSFFESIIANQANKEIEYLTGFKVDEEFDDLGDELDLDVMMRWDLTNYLPDDLLLKVDRATMYNSIECREPFIDHRLVELAFQIPMELRIKDGEEKYLIRKLLGRYMPKDLFERKKQGFSIPIFDWFSKDLDQKFKSHFTIESIKEIPFLIWSEVDHEHKKYQYFKKKGKQYNIEKMWRILSIVLWWEKYIQK